LLTSAECERLCVVLVRTRNPLNIGAAARAMSNFGFSELRVVASYEAAFREARSAVGASSVLASAQEYAGVAEAVADCRLVVGTTAVRQRELQHPLRRLETGALDILMQVRGQELGRKELGGVPSREATPRVAIMFGSEKTGLSNEALSYCHWLMRIPTSDRNISMNLGQAVAVCLYELVRDGTPARPPQTKTETKTKTRERAAAGETERMTALLVDALHASGYLPPRAAAPTPERPTRCRESQSQRAGIAEEKLRRLVRRLDLSADDAEVWLGIFRQIVWKLSSADCPPSHS
jgi:TrmH family RNA methyltransferase